MSGGGPRGQRPLTLTKRLYQDPKVLLCCGYRGMTLSLCSPLPSLLSLSSPLLPLSTSPPLIPKMRREESAALHMPFLGGHPWAELLLTPHPWTEPSQNAAGRALPRSMTRHFAPSVVDRGWVGNPSSSWWVCLRKSQSSIIL